MVLQVDAAARRDLAAVLDRLRAVRREQRGMTQGLLASRLGVVTGSVADWEAGRNCPELGHLIGWARELGERLVVIDRNGCPATLSVGPDDGEQWAVFELRRLVTPLWARRRSRELSQTELAEAVGVSRLSVQRWEAAKVFPRPIALVVWARVLGCTVALAPVHQSGMRACVCRG